VTPQLVTYEADSGPSATVTDIVLVQDNALEVELTLRPLRELDAGIQIEISRDGEEALDLLLGRGAFRHRLTAPLPRLVMLDLKLPKMDGIEVLRGVRANSRTCLIPIVMLTSSADPRQLAQCYQLGANSCVQKPVRHQEFGSAIQDVARYWLNLNQAPPSAQPAT